MPSKLGALSLSDVADQGEHALAKGERVKVIIAAAVMWVLTLPTYAQDRPDTILVIDGSGSMKEYLDGSVKMQIAKSVINGVLRRFPPEQSLGLIVYGQSALGNCGDIDTLVDPDIGTAYEISNQIQQVEPLGETPMAAAVVAAAEALQYQTEPARVILVTDGAETCSADPCKAIRRLHELAVDLKAHVVGFDVTDDAALTQMACIADATGGEFVTAASADELATALGALTHSDRPLVGQVVFVARLRDQFGGLVQDVISWNVTGPDGMVVWESQGNPLTLRLPFGRYHATTVRQKDGAQSTGAINVDRATGATVTLTLRE